jgi:hypothetical protein
MIFLWVVPPGAPAGHGGQRQAKRVRVSFRNVGRGLVLSLLILALAGGCSRTRIAYNFSDWFLLHRIDHYFNLNSGQEQFLETRIHAFQAWHRKHELPRWVEALEELEKRYADGLSLDDADWAESRYTDLWRRLIDHGLPDFSLFLTTVNAAQIQYLQDRFDNSDDWLTRQASLNETDLIDDQRSWVEGVFESWYGHLDTAQLQRIQGWVHTDPAWMQIRLKNRKQFQQEFVALLKQRLPADRIQHRLTRWLHHPETRWEPGFHERLEARSREWKSLIVRVDALMAPGQRRHALERIRGYRHDFQALADAS